MKEIVSKFREALKALNIETSETSLVEKEIIVKTTDELITAIFREYQNNFEIDIIRTAISKMRYFDHHSDKKALEKAIAAYHQTYKKLLKQKEKNQQTREELGSFDLHPSLFAYKEKDVYVIAARLNLEELKRLSSLMYTIIPKKA